MTAWAAFYPFVLPAVRGCDTDVVDFHIREAAIEFCRRSQCWKQEIPITPVADQPSYLIPLPTGAVASLLLRFTLININGIAFDSYGLVAPERGRELDREYVYSCYAYLSDDGLTLTVQPVPSAIDGQLVPYLSLKPARAATSIPDFIFEQYADSIAAGALAKLLDMPKTNWRDAGKAATSHAKFEADCGSAAVRVSRGAARSRTRSRGCFF